MAYDYSDLVEQSKQWALQASTVGWIDDSTAQHIAQLDARTPNSLFNQAGQRPLIVAFMGGTGVGKSSLLNRLAGQAIARTGIERPTSREVTLYHHQSVRIDHLPEKLPVDRIKIAQHKEEQKRDIIWIDMPDFDSTEQSNKYLVLEWLPHIDVLIYVVSPERYRDEKAWRLLLAEGGRHAWLFVLNQWDRGQTEQYEDFKLQLGKAGFIDPIIFKTVCADNSNYPDEFDVLQNTINGLANNHAVEQINQRSLQVRKDELKQQLQQAMLVLGSAEIWQPIGQLWRQQWQKTTQLLNQGFEWPIKKLSMYYAEHAADLLGTANASEKMELAIWDDWAQTRFADALDQFVHDADQLGLPPMPLKNGLVAVRDKASKIIQSQTELAARQALANPGNALQRNFLKLMRVLEFVLPLLAMAWVAYQVFVGYYESNMTDVEYLGVNFAVHSSLLVVVSWLAPWFMRRQLKPSLEKSLLVGLKKGTETAIAMINGEVNEAISDVNRLHLQQLQQLSHIVERTQVEGVEIKGEANQTLTRMLPT